MRVGFIGIGNMGWPMAGHIAAAGHEVTVFDVDADRRARFAGEHNCRAASSVGEIAANEISITMLPTGQIVRQSLLEDEGGAFAKALRPGALVIDMSSSEPMGTRELGKVLDREGVALIDAPVSGAVPRAKTGTLAIMIGGDDKKAIERAKPLLLSMGKQLFETGPLGSGHAMKALNNYIAAAGYTAVAEALLIGQRFGLDQNVMVDILNVSTGRNFTTEVMIKEHVLGGKFATGFALGLMAKDVKIAADLGEAVALDAPVSRLVRERWASARDKLGAARDTSEAILSWKDDLGPKRTSEVAYALWFEEEQEQSEDIELLIGIYEREADAKEAIQRLKEKPGFAAFPEGFKIYEYTFGRTSWEEGFVTPPD